MLRPFDRVMCNAGYAWRGVAVALVLCIPSGDARATPTSIPSSGPNPAKEPVQSRPEYPAGATPSGADGGSIQPSPAQGPPAKAQASGIQNTKGIEVGARTSNEPRKDRPQIALGLVMGGTSGMGLGLRLHGRRGLSLTVGGYYLPAGDVHSADLGVQMLWTILRRKYARFYLMAGVHYFDAVAPSPDTWRWEWPGFRALNLGPGIGTELRKGRVGVAVEMPLSVAFALTRETFLTYQGRWNFLPLPNAWFTIYLK